MNACRSAHAAMCLAAMIMSAGALAEGAQQSTFSAIGVLNPGTKTAAALQVTALRRALADIGYQDGRNIGIHERFAEGRADLLPVLAAELDRLGVKLIVTSGTTAVRAALSATSTTPIVMAGSGDPVSVGLARSLARPAGRVTGLSIFGEEIIGKRVDLLHELLPEGPLFVGLLNPANPGNPIWKRAMQSAASSLGTELITFEVRSADELADTFDRIAAVSPSGVIVIEDPLFVSHAARVSELALRYKLPTMVGSLANVRDGALLAYAIDYVDLWRRSALYVDRILKGVPASDQPIEQPTRFELVINLKTAEALGVTIPPTLLARADEVIE